MTRFIIALALACVACDESDTYEAPVPVEQCEKLCAAIDACDLEPMLKNDYDGPCASACVDGFFDRPCYWACSFYPLPVDDCDYILDVLRWCGALFPLHNVYAVEVCQ
jgi:nitrous oxide reductase accessory protein NosL